MEALSTSSLGYACKMASPNEPALLPQEEVYVRLNGIKFEDQIQKKKFEGGALLLTTLRVIWFKGNQGLEIPLFYVKEYKKGGGLFKSPSVVLTLFNLECHSPYMIDYQKSILQQANTQPYKPTLPTQVAIKFKEGNREKFIEMLKESLQQRHWTIPIRTTTTGGTAQEHLIPSQTVKQVGGGISGIKKTIEDKTKYNQTQITSAFQDLNSLKDKARGLVGIANQIQNKIKKKEVNAESEEIKEIQSVMFNMGIIQDFSSQVTKDLAGKNYYVELAREVEKFSCSVLEKFGGVLAIVDIYCMYNRARGTDLISPEDLIIACEKLNQISDRVFLRTFHSGVKVLQLKHFNQESYFKKLVELAKEQPGLTADKLAGIFKVNVMLMKEQLREAEEKGYLCRDESFEGLRYYENLFLQL